MIEVGTWRNFDEIEECLILDELMMLTQALGKKQKSTFRMLAASQGYDIPDDDYEDDLDNKGDDDLPEELLEAERALQARKREELGKSNVLIKTEGGLGLGYESL